MCASVDDILKTSLTSSIKPAAKAQIIRGLWGMKDVSQTPQEASVDFEAYYEYYVEQCTLALHDGGRHASVRTHRDVLDVAQLLIEPKVRDEIRADLSSSLSTPKPANDQELLDGSIDLAARLLSMTRIGSPSYGFSGAHELSWKAGTLTDFLHGYYSDPGALQQEQVELEKLFNARNLDRLGGIEVEWTSNLADHLRLMDDDRKVGIFHHVSFLENQQNALFPDGFVEETLMTLALLLPSSDKETRKWFRRQARMNKLDTKAIHCGRVRADDRHIDRFRFWRDRLVILKQNFDEAEPGTLSQWWYDRRKGPQWYTFWVAIIVLVLTIIFGIIQSVEGGLQAYKAFSP